MAIKKSELYSSLWASCDELRGGMDASQYKDYVLTMLFVKYISDKYKNDHYGAITVPEGATFDDMVGLIGNPDIGDKFNKEILNPIKEANKLNEFPDFNDESKLGKGKDLVDTVSNLVRIFNDPSLDFAGNSAEGDDILGDAYEFLMRHFATESGKSKGQFYTPAEVSRILAKVIGINPNNATNQTTAYDPTCGSGSLLLKVANESGKDITLYGQEKETTTANLARMNMILHNSPTAEIVADNTLSRPAYKENDGTLKRFDYVVANPPFSLKSWSNGVNIDNDEYNRFSLGTPPDKNGDYAFLEHIIASLKNTGKAAVVLPHGVLFRGNAEGEIRKNILKKGYIKGIIGLPANLFYGTGIPACIIVLDKENAEHRKGIFMIDASKGFMKDGNKNRLREQDLRKITDVFASQEELPRYSRMVSITEISDAKNDYNLNIPRYIDTQEAEDVQNIEAHLQGGIPEADVEALNAYWKVFKSLKEDLFQADRAGFVSLKVPASQLKTTILNHSEFLAFDQQVKEKFASWMANQKQDWSALTQGDHPKEVIAEASQSLLRIFDDYTLLDAYDLYQHLMAYWSETMQDDVYSVAIDGWKAGNDYQRLVLKGKTDKKGKTTADKDVPGLAGIEGRMISPDLLVKVYFQKEQGQISKIEQELEQLESRLTELEEEIASNEFFELDDDLSFKKGVEKLIKDFKANKEPKDNYAVLTEYIEIDKSKSPLNTDIKKLNADLEQAVLAKYPALNETEIKDLVIVKKWQAQLEYALIQEQERIGQNLTQRIKELADRYSTTLYELQCTLSEAEGRVKSHLEKMGLLW